ncbi:hypothetical protein [Streptosporangium canum]|uniref:hypothetical protein n=1 Tax=Streptosporangium canum TaxID=324952 RepID=UPI0034282CF8
MKTDNSGPAKESNNCSTSERAQPTEGVWSSLRAKVLNFAVGGIDQLTVLIKNRLKPMQYRPDLLDGFIAETGLVISDPE